MPSRPTKLRQATERRILESVIDAISRRGVYNSSMAEIAKSANVSKATLYRYFPSKEALLDEIGVYTLEKFLVGLREAMEGIDSGAKILQRLVLFLQEFHNDINAASLLAAEPHLSLKIFRMNFPFYLDAISENLNPLIVEGSQALPCPIDTTLIAEIILRTQLSSALVPMGPQWSEAPKKVSLAWDSIASRP